MKKVIVSFLAFGTLSAMAIPAQADTVTVIDGSQTSITTGNGNHAIQDSVQNINSHSQNTNDNTSTSARSDQYSDVYGHGNTIVQRSIQNTNNHSVRPRYHRPAHPLVR